MCVCIFMYIYMVTCVCKFLIKLFVYIGYIYNIICIYIHTLPFPIVGVSNSKSGLVKFV